MLLSCSRLFKDLSPRRFRGSRLVLPKRHVERMCLPVQDQDLDPEETQRNRSSSHTVCIPLVDRTLLDHTLGYCVNI